MLCKLNNGDIIEDVDETECENIPNAYWEHEYLTCGIADMFSLIFPDICEELFVPICCNEMPTCNQLFFLQNLSPHCL